MVQTESPKLSNYSLSRNQTKRDKIPSLELAKIALAELKLLSFIEQAWKVLEPSTPFKSGWHIEAICEHLQAIVNNQIKNLIINIPPRMMKSLSVSVFFPCWLWITKPETRWLFASYSHDLSIRDSIKCRRLIQSLWYQARWGHKFVITSDQNQKSRYDNDRMGYRLSTSVGGLGTGEGGDYIICIPEGYYINTDKGEIDIKEIVEEKLSVKILSYNHELKKVEYKEIESYEQREAKEIIEIDLGNGEILECTPDHLIYVEGQGYKRAGSLENGDVVLYERELVNA